MARWYHDKEFDLLLTPTMRIPPTQLGALQWPSDDPDRWLTLIRSYGAFTRTQNMTGQPAMSVPLYWNSDGVPIGVQFAARYGDEATLFRLASQLERARPWTTKVPAIHCSTQT